MIKYGEIKPGITPEENEYLEKEAEQADDLERLDGDIRHGFSKSVAHRLKYHKQVKLEVTE